MKVKKDRSFISIYIVFSIVFTTLLCLGMWQLNKHNAKTYKKSLIDLKFKEVPKGLAEVNLNSLELEIIKINGSFIEDKSLFFEPRTYKGKIGYHMLTPIKTKNKFFLVNRGFITKKEKNNITKKNIDNIEGIIIKFPKPKFFELKNDIENNLWYSLEIGEISNYLNIRLEPYLIYELDSTNSKLVNVRPNYLSDINHLNYAFTWFMLAITLSIILIFFIRKV